MWPVERRGPSATLHNITCLSGLNMLEIRLLEYERCNTMKLTFVNKSKTKLEENNEEMVCGE